ncbi:kelch-like protein Diablo [Acrasis kona]|uniref:Kelch-like protein Diablo n=1 Tax=Acrasis kona TaxID=1008807 RepID=A0AAW2YVL8_9EUKA
MSLTEDTSKRKTTADDLKDNTPLKDHEQRMLKALKSLFSKTMTPNVHDLVIKVGEEQIHCLSGLLMSQSSYFKRLITEARSKSEDIPTVITIEDQKQDAIKNMVQYYMTAHMDIDSTTSALNVIELAKRVDCDKCCIAARTYIERQLLIFFDELKFFEGFALLDDLENVHMCSKTVSDRSEEILNKYSTAILEDVDFVCLPRSTFSKILSKDDLEMVIKDEYDLLNKIIEWGVVNITNRRDRIVCEDEGSRVYVCSPQRRIQVISKADASKYDNENIVYCSELRQFIDDLLFLVRYEHIPPQHIINKLEPKHLFTAQELIQLFKAGVSAKNKLPYQILNKFEANGEEETRKKRQRETLGSFDFFVSKEAILSNNRVILPTFLFCNTSWYVMVMTSQHKGEPHLSFYLYNKVITDVGHLEESIPTIITFRLVNTDGGAKKQKFTKTWQEVKAWGYANVIPINDLLNPVNKWLSSDEKINLQVSINVQ